MHEFGHRGEISTRSGISASPGLTSLARSSRAIPAKQGAFALKEFMVILFILSTPCDPDPRWGLLARSQRHYLAEKKATEFTASLFVSRRPSEIGASHDRNMLRTDKHQISANTYIDFVQ